MRHYSGEVVVQTSRDLVWGFLMDPERIGPCLPDLVEMNVESDTRFRAKVRVGLGPIRGTFEMQSTLEAVVPGKVTRMSAKGGGMGSGIDLSSEMILEEGDEGVGTRLTWSADVSVSGPIAAVGGRLMDGQAKKVTDQVFANIRSALDRLAEEPAGKEAAAGSQDE